MDKAEDRSYVFIPVVMVAFCDKIDTVQDQRGKVEVQRGRQVFFQCSKERCSDQRSNYLNK